MLALAIFVGAGLGGVARYTVGGWVQGATGAGFPWGTLVVNVTGSVLLAFSYAFMEGTGAPAVWRAFLGIGILGGYTTFSSFGYETIRLLQDGQWIRAGVYILASVIISLLGVVLGFRAAATVLRG
ncbi:MAG: fluoride efflux transporter CrcB [Longimicrobiales bacterium]